MINESKINYMKPYKEKIYEGYSIRTFSRNASSSELKWHTDGENRIVIPLNENDWMIQLDDELPKPFKGKIFIPEGKYHRIIKGSSDLKVKVIKESKEKKTKIRNEILDLLGSGLPKNINKAFELAKKYKLKIKTLL